MFNLNFALYDLKAKINNKFKLILLMMSSDSDKQAKGANTANSPKASNQTSLTASELDVKKIGSSTSKEGKHYDSLADAD